ncbi:MAG: type II toxin-antitoxin system RelE/ParE family toxin [Candidatus ainarchaeum sp.]|nr:type II toxin-antitoxin system RelE/ParE family toxin [Candidatus ainarchaeum sp.]
MKTVRVILSSEAEEVYKYLNEHAAHSKSEQIFLNAVKKKIELIKANPHYGDSVPKKLIPREYQVKYGINNLFRVELPKYWRMLYTLTEGESQIEIVAFVLDMIDHKEYDRKFGYGSG